MTECVHWYHKWSSKFTIKILLHKSQIILSRFIILTYSTVNFLREKTNNECLLINCKNCQSKSSFRLIVIFKSLTRIIFNGWIWLSSTKASLCHKKRRIAESYYVIYAFNKLKHKAESAFSQTDSSSCAQLKIAAKNRSSVDLDTC